MFSADSSVFAQNQIYIPGSEYPSVISVKTEVAPTGALSTFEFGRILAEHRSIAQRGSAAKKKRRGNAVVCVDVQLFIAENRTKRKTAQCSVPINSRGIYY